MGRKQISRRQKDFFNNTRASNVITKLNRLDKSVQVYEHGVRKKNEYLMMECSSNDINLKKVVITPFDISVLDTVYTLFQRGEQYFTIESLANELAKQEVSFRDRGTEAYSEAMEALRSPGDTKIDADFFASYYDFLRFTISKLQGIVITLNCGSIKCADGSDIFDDVEVSGSLLPVRGVAYTSRTTKQKKAKYKILDKPLLHIYGEALGRIISVPSRLLEIDGIRNTRENIVLKQEIVKMIALMKNPRNNYQSREITYVRADGTMGELFSRIGLKKEDYTPESWKNKIRKIHKTVGVILQSLVEQNYIEEFEEITENRRGGGARGYYIYFEEVM